MSAPDFDLFKPVSVQPETWRANSSHSMFSCVVTLCSLSPNFSSINKKGGGKFQVPWLPAFHSVVYIFSEWNAVPMIIIDTPSWETWMLGRRSPVICKWQYGIMRGAKWGQRER